MTRTRDPRTLLAVLVGAVVLALLGASVSNAAALSLSGSKRPFMTSQSRCTSQTVAVTTTAPSGTASNVAVSNLATAGCTGKALVVTVYDGTVSPWTAAKRFEATGTVSAATATLTGATFTPSAAQKVLVTIGGWPVPATWTYAPAASAEPVTPSPGTNLPSITWTLVTNNPVQACFTAQVTTASTTPVAWSLLIDTTKPPFNGQASPSTYSPQSDNGRNNVFAQPGNPSIVVVDGNKYDQVWRYVVAGETRTVQICNYSLPPGVQTPGAYSVTVTQGTGVNWSTQRACQTVTITGNGASRFYFGWTVPAFDLSAARARVVGFTNWSWDALDWQVTRTNVSGNVYSLVSTSPSNIAGTQVFTYTACAVGQG